MSILQVGQPAPHFTCTAVVDGRLKEVSLSSYTEATHWVILLFFPKAWSQVCPTEIKAFSDRLEEFLYSRACAILFASTDSVDCLRAWNSTGAMDGGLGNVNLPLIGDCNHRLSRAYGVLNEELGVAQRALFLIDPNGIIRGISSNDAYIARNVNEVLRLLDALIFKDEYGEGCPADWTKGDQGIDMQKQRVEGVLDIKKAFSQWIRPKLERTVSGTSMTQRSAHASVDTTPGNDRSRKSELIDRMAPTSIGVPSYPASGPTTPNSPLASPKNGDFFNMRPASRVEVQMEGTIVERMENMNAALENYRNSQTSIGTTSG